MSVLAHQGGWDEILFVVVPLAACGGLLWTANRRVKKQIAEAPDTSDQQESDTREQ